MDEQSVDNKTDDGHSRVSPLTIRVLIIHPTIDPAVITKTLGVEPSTQRRVGYPMTLFSGKPGPLAFESAWSSWRDYYEQEPSINGRLAEFLQPFILQADFVRKLVAEGDASVILSFPGQLYFGGEIDSETLRAVVDLGFDLGIEVFPNSAT